MEVFEKYFQSEEYVQCSPVKLLKNKDKIYYSDKKN